MPMMLRTGRLKALATITGRGRTDGALVSCQGDCKPLTVSEMRRRIIPPQERAGDDLLARALRRARWTIFWERLWPALASIATVIGLFLALSWLGLWLSLPPTGRAIGLGIFFLLTAAAF